ncbi:transportin-1-like [Durio zibethinus]|uniref:Transportin-1-like n=1 Tax=Durio zibethinus TaxID=66656 RepID=A0A6P5ZR78_DURZI|nr:transportin-1-like [Durio zibethinus]
MSACCGISKSPFRSCGRILLGHFLDSVQLRALVFPLYQSSGHQKGYEQFDAVLMGMLRRILDANKLNSDRFQQLFYSFEAAEEVAPSLEIIVYASL